MCSHLSCICQYELCRYICKSVYICPCELCRYICMSVSLVSVHVSSLGYICIYCKLYICPCKFCRNLFVFLSCICQCELFRLYLYACLYCIFACLLYKYICSLSALYSICPCCSVDRICMPVFVVSVHVCPVGYVCMSVCHVSVHVISVGYIGMSNVCLSFICRCDLHIYICSPSVL